MATDTDLTYDTNSAGCFAAVLLSVLSSGVAIKTESVWWGVIVYCACILLPLGVRLCVSEAVGAVHEVRRKREDG